MCVYCTYVWLLDLHLYSPEPFLTSMHLFINTLSLPVLSMLFTFPPKAITAGLLILICGLTVHSSASSVRLMLVHCSGWPVGTASSQ